MSKHKRVSVGRAIAKRIQREPVQDVQLDGPIPPGLRMEDVAAVGQRGAVHFSGHYYGLPDEPLVRFDRPVIVWFQTAKLQVLQDLEHGNLYVIDRDRSLSLGCLMSARFHEGAEADTQVYRLTSGQVRRVGVVDQLMRD